MASCKLRDEKVEEEEEETDEEDVEGEMDDSGF